MKTINMRILALLTLATMVLAEEDRDGRFYWHSTSTHLETVVERYMVNKLEPSSCVVVPTELPYCLADVPYITPTATLKSASTTTSGTPKLEGSEKSEGWGNKFVGYILPTKQIVTSKITKSETSTVTLLDNNHVVTFSVVGCRPTQLPCNLTPCA